MTERKCTCNKLFSILVNLAGGRGPTKRNWIPKFYRQCKLAGPQHRGFQKEILQTVQVGVGRRNKFCENIISVPLPRTIT
ncbi:TPA: hypothetical protein I2T90_12540 [Staphylococcus aureus]|nr:hypothetical protein CU118_01625 [Staphylococcus aureus]MSN56910.1 hypothetical protein [Staphylococcus aureus]MSN62595.1 hypothetical protein [Staphylococcus aureus]MSN64383.1 hypothetical protein [Staphylococcus aureus]MSN69102.1 hypothetical protein [Staphylococcus aureus]